MLVSAKPDEIREDIDDSHLLSPDCTCRKVDPNSGNCSRKGAKFAEGTQAWGKKGELMKINCKRYKMRYTIFMKWFWILLLFPALASASENCAEQIKGTCRDACGPNEVAEQGAFIDCGEMQKCCVQKDPIASAASSQVILIDNYTFSPAEIRVPGGTEVIWKNNDGVEHTVTAADASFDSGTLAPGAEYKRKFTNPGTYSYNCDMHPSMSGKVVVE
jgi:plastocyanin